MLDTKMTAERWETLFETVLERDGSLRVAFLDEACSGDLSLMHYLDLPLRA